MASGEARGGVGAATFFGKLKKDFLISYLSKFAVNHQIEFLILLMSVKFENQFQ